MPPLEDPVIPEDEAQLEIFGDMPDDEDLSALDRGDVVEEITEPDAAPAEEAAAPEPAEEPAPEPEVAAEPEPEPTAESVATEAVATDPEPEPDPEPAPEPKADISIPKERLDIEIQRRKALEERLALIEAQNKKPAATEPEEDPFDMKAAVQSEYEAVMEGNLDKAAEIRIAINAKMTEAQTRQINQAAEQATSVTKEQLTFEDKVAELTEEFPTFDPDAAEFKPDLLKDVLFKRDAYAQAGMDLTTALETATYEVATLNGINAKSLDDTGVEVSRETEKHPKLSAAEQKAAKATVQKKIDAAAAQPPDIQGESSDAKGASALNFDNMTEEEFDALPEATLKRYRGD